MLILPQLVKMKWNGNNKSYYIKKEYIYTKLGDVFDVYVLDLPESSGCKVEVICDYCNNNMRVKYCKFNSQRSASVVGKDACAKCTHLKRKESNLINYGVENVASLPRIREKIEKTMIERYGEKTSLLHKGTLEKIKQTNISKYGTEHPLQNEHINDKVKSTTISRYGYYSVFLNEGIKEKIKKTNNERFGVDYCFQNSDVIEKRSASMYANGTAPTSRQQIYLWELFGGELNYPIRQYSLDIAFPNEKVYIEYDGSGHDLALKMGKINQEELVRKQETRYQLLNQLGWNMFRIISPKDYLPSDNLLLEEFNKAKNHFAKDEDYRIYIGCKSIDSIFGKLRKIKKGDLQNVYKSPLISTQKSL